MKSLPLGIVLLVCVAATLGGPVQRRSPGLNPFKCCTKGSRTTSPQRTATQEQPQQQQQQQQQQGNRSPGPMSRYASPAGILRAGHTPPRSPSRLFGNSPKVLGGTGSVSFPTTKQRRPGGIGGK
ncbi:Splicing factor 3B subunit 1 [Frankliniella fusca]|uniref:Splicing factor 3B subunit 1 n=1 Tax=Frankliniella fusca TaxID=407009 RepID=A0AAE1HFI2_9NEOP|nr:Splicing factor 3B subunit 1 [Frankliniella fusca]